MQRGLKLPVKQTDNTNLVLRDIEKRVDMILSAMVTDVYRLSQQQVPVSAGGGHLQSSGITKRSGHLEYQIKYNKEYAAYQHRGMRRDGTHVVRNYTYPGKKSHYLTDPANQIFRNQDSYIKRYMK
jgi:hypothetical protein